MFPCEVRDTIADEETVQSSLHLEQQFYFFKNGLDSSL